MKNVLLIIKKEFARFFGDKRLVFTSLIMPGLMIYVLYTFMGSGIGSMFNSGGIGLISSDSGEIMTLNLPESISGILEYNRFTAQKIEESELENTMEAVRNSEVPLLMIFPADFDKTSEAYNPQKTSLPAPNIEIYYNSGDSVSMFFYNEVMTALSGYEDSLVNRFDINKSGTTEYDLFDEGDILSTVMSSMLPLLLIIFMFSGCLAIAPESISGEKERGTIATILITPIKRSELALGKIISLAVIAFLCGVSSFAGTMLSFPNLVGDVSVSLYGLSDYMNIALIIMTTILFMISVLSVMSAYAKTVKEATALISPLMIIIGIIGVSAMFSSGAPKNVLIFLIPLYNSVQCLSAVFSYTLDSTCLIITAVSNIVYTAAVVFVLTKMFNSEKILFSK